MALAYGLHLLLTRRRDVKRMLLDGAAFLLLFLIVMSPWTLFNLSYSGCPFPNTIAAKFMQYGYPPSAGRSLHYFLDVLIYFLNGPLLLLALGAGYAIYGAVRTKNLPILYAPLWSVSLIGLYAVALPVIYDQGRYLMPILPFIIVYGVEGLNHILHLLSPRSTVLRAAVWTVLFGMVFVLWVNGASDFSYRVSYSTPFTEAPPDGSTIMQRRMRSWPHMTLGSLATKPSGRSWIWPDGQAEIQ